MLRYLQLIIILFSLAFPALADEPQQCSFPEPGRWMLNMLQTQTNLGPGGGPASQPFDLVVEDCGASLLTYGFGGENGGYEKRLYRTTEDAYTFETTYRGIPVNVTMEMESTREMSGEWTFGSFARAPGEAEFLGNETIDGVNPLCECDAFRQRLLNAIESDEYYKSMYGDPRYAERPEALESWIEWNWATQDKLINMVADQSNPVSYEEAVSNYTEHAARARLNGRAASPTEEQAGDHRHSNSVGTAGYTDPATCEAVVTPATGCAADILNRATKAHEDHHSETCAPLRDAEQAHNPLDGNAPPTYAHLINSDPAFNAQNEVEAYEIGIAYIRDTYLAMCKTPLN
jgi:hypothetical protein